MPPETAQKFEALRGAGAAPDGGVRARRLRARRAGRHPAGRACSSTWSARACARAPTCSPIPTARSCACAPTSPCRPAGCIWSAIPAGNVPARYCYSARPSAISRPAPTRAHPREFRQAGIESFAAADREQDDAAVRATHRRGAARGRPRAASRCARRPRPVHRAARRAADAGALAPPPASTSSGGPRRSAPSWRASPPGRRSPRRACRPRSPTRSIPPIPAAPSRIVGEHLDQAGIELIGTRSLAEIAAAAAGRGRRRRARRRCRPTTPR